MGHHSVATVTPVVHCKGTGHSNVKPALHVYSLPSRSIFHCLFSQTALLTGCPAETVSCSHQSTSKNICSLNTHQFGCLTPYCFTASFVFPLHSLRSKCISFYSGNIYSLQPTTFTFFCLTQLQNSHTRIVSLRVILCKVECVIQSTKPMLNKHPTWCRGWCEYEHHSHVLLILHEG